MCEDVGGSCGTLLVRVVCVGCLLVVVCVSGVGGSVIRGTDFGKLCFYCVDAGTENIN